MEQKPLAIILTSLIAMFLAFIYSFYMPTANFLVGTPLIFLTLGFFMFGVLAFGYTLPLLSAFYGLAMGANEDASIFIFMIPLTIAAYAGVLLGSSLEDDFKVRSYFLKNGRQVATLAVIAIVLAVAIEYAYPLFINSLPQDLFGFTFKEGVTTASAMDQLISLK